ncbi:MAG: hypothetical protein ABIQ13_05500 [Pedococcus sp.]
MSSHTTHPLVDAWLRDLEQLLQGIEPGERAEVLAGVREHLDGSLPAGATDADVRRVLTELGSPQSVADEAYAGRPAPATAGAAATAVPAVPADRMPAMTRGWVPITVGILLGLALVLASFVVSATSGYSTSSISSSAATPVDPGTGTVVDGPTGGSSTTETTIAYDANPVFNLAVALASSWLLWLPATVLVLFSPLWSTRQKVALSLLTPVAALLMSALPALGWAFTGKEIGINVGAVTGLALALAGGGWLLVRLCRSAAAASARGVPA